MNKRARSQRRALFLFGQVSPQIPKTCGDRYGYFFCFGVEASALVSDQRPTGQVALVSRLRFQLWRLIIPAAYSAWRSPSGYAMVSDVPPDSG